MSAAGHVLRRSRGHRACRTRGRPCGPRGRERPPMRAGDRPARVAALAPTARSTTTTLVGERARTVGGTRHAGGTATTGDNLPGIGRRSAATGVATCRVSTSGFRAADIGFVGGSANRYGEFCRETAAVEPIAAAEVCRQRASEVSRGLPLRFRLASGRHSPVRARVNGCLSAPRHCLSAFSEFSPTTRLTAPPPSLPACPSLTRGPPGSGGTRPPHSADQPGTGLRWPAPARLLSVR